MWNDVLQPDGTVADNEALAYEHDLVLLCEFPGANSEPSLIFKHFQDGHFGDVSHIDNSAAGVVGWIDTAGDGSQTNLLLTSFTGTGYVQIALDGKTGFAGVGANVFSVGAPQALWHVHGNGLYDGDLAVVGKVGFNNVAPPVQPAHIADPSADAAACATSIATIIDALEAYGLLALS